MGGSSIPTAKNVDLEINNNLEAPHYLNGSRDIGTPFQQNRDITMTVTLDLDSIEAEFLYNEFYKGGSTFNAVLDFDQDNSLGTVGSQHATFTMSGCTITSMENTSTMEGLTESTIEVRPQNISAQEWTSTASSSRFNPW